MDMKEFESLAESWGGDIARWPEAVRPAAAALLEAEPSAAACLREAAQLDAILAEEMPVPASDLLERRIMRAFPKPAFDADWRRPAVAAAAALVIGLMGGFAGGTLVPAQQDDTISLEYADAFDGLMEDWSAWEWSDA
ncbi:hypothetical protein [Hyphobacterium sp.]|uniref:hypothetical protein n=1 Tax=Hyphobacterium sp. TaxID=2004662 RepID=UPI003748D9C5